MKKIILSDNKQNQLVDEITDALLQRHSFAGGYIGGKEVAGFCPHQQVNNFIMFRIYQDWNAHMQGFVHPYFDFGQAEVREAMRRFQNTVSRHIRISEKDMRKLVRQAVYNCLRLVLNPQETIVNFFFSNAQVIPAEIYRRHAPYFSDFDFAIQAIMRYLENNDLRKIERTLFLEKFNRVIALFEEKEAKRIGEYQRFLFRRLTGKEMDDIVGGAPRPTEDPTAERKKAEAERKAEEARLQAEAEKREEERLAAQMRREEEARKAAEEARKQAEAKKAEADRKAEEARKKAEADRNKPRVILNPRPRPETPATPPPPPPPEKKPSIPAWVEKPKTKSDPKPPEPPKPKPKEVGKSTLPAWIERPERKPHPEVKVKPRSEPDPPASPSVPPKTVASESEKPRTLSDAMREKQEERSPSLNEMFARREEKRDDVSEPQPEPKAQTPPTLADQPVASPPPQKETPPPPAEEPKAEGPPPVSLFTSLDSEDKTEAEKPRTLADSFQDRSNSGSINEKIAGKAIKTEQIPVHKQFQFVQRVFGGSSVKFKVVLDKINKTSTVEEALGVLDKYVYNDPNVNRNDKVAKEFETLVRNKFA
ncbi:MAG: hypothetical protein AAGN35_19695 [Bacteroidota bacterium]